MKRALHNLLDVCILVIAIGLVTAQGPKEIPPCRGAECTGHESQPDWCQNADGNGYKKRLFGSQRGKRPMSNKSASVQESEHSVEFHAGNQIVILDYKPSIGEPNGRKP